MKSLDSFLLEDCKYKNGLYDKFIKSINPDEIDGHIIILAALDRNKYFKKPDEYINIYLSYGNDKSLLLNRIQPVKDYRGIPSSNYIDGYGKHLSEKDLFYYNEQLISNIDADKDYIARAHLCLAYQYYYGSGTSENINKAIQHLEHSAKLGNSYAQFILGFFCIKYEQYKSAMDFFMQSAIGGFNEAMYIYGIMQLPLGLKPCIDYELPYNESQAYFWLENAAKRCSITAEIWLCIFTLANTHNYCSIHKAVDTLAQYAIKQDYNAEYVLDLIYSNFIEK